MNKYLSLLVFLPLFLITLYQTLGALQAKHVYQGYKYAILSLGVALWGVAGFASDPAALYMKRAGALALIISGLMMPDRTRKEKR